MSRWNANLDDPYTEDGDMFFVGYNSKIHRSQLPPGIVAKSVNKRMEDRTAQPRAGTTMPPANFHFGGITPGVTFLGSAVYNNPNGQERLILLQQGAFGQGPIGAFSYNFDTDSALTIEFPGGLPLSPYYAWFAQGFDKLVMIAYGLQHGDQGLGTWTNALSWDGNETTAMFQWFAPPNPAVPILAVIPPSFFAWPVSNRIFYLPLGYPPVPIGGGYIENLPTDNILLSDIEDYSNFDFVLGNIRINAGEAEYITTVVPYAYDSCVIAKRNSLHLLSNFSADLSLAQQELITRYAGICSPKGFVQIGTEVYFMANKLGVFKLSEVIEKRLMMLPLPVSDDIKPDIDRINWGALLDATIPYQQRINLIQLNTIDHLLLIAAPIDGATVNNAIFVYNTVTGHWETIDMWAQIPGFAIDNLLAIHIGGVRRLIAVQNDPALVYLMYDGTSDQTSFLPAVFSPVRDVIETRGYGLNPDSGPTGFRTFHRGAIVMSTLSPDVRITAIPEGPYEEKVLRDSITKVAARSYIEGVADIDPLAARPSLIKREDYTVTGSPFGFDSQDFGTFSDGAVNDNIVPPNPPQPDQTIPIEPEQVSRERFRVRVTDRWLSLRIENCPVRTTGQVQNPISQCALLATSVESTESKRQGRVAA